MKILFISHLYPSSVEPGRALFNRQLIKAMRGQVDVKVVAPYFWFPGKKTLSAREVLDGVDVLHPRIPYVPGVLIHKHWILYRRFVRSTFLETLNEFKPDHVILGFLYPDVVAMGEICRDMGIEYSVRVNGSDFYVRARQDKFRGMVLDELMKAPRIFCPGEALKKAMVAEGVDEGKIVAFDNGVDGGRFKHRPKGDALKQLLSDNSRQGRDKCSLLGGRNLEASRIILFAGNLVHVKNPGLAIEAFASLVKSYKLKVNGGNAIRENLPSACLGEAFRRRRVLCIIGDGPERQKLERQARKLGVGERVHFLGSRLHSDVALWMNVADCLCLSSRSEGMPNVVIEALTSGLPVVATDVGECSRMLSDEANSKIVPNGDSDKMAVALNDVLNMDVDRQAMAERYNGRYSWERTARMIIGILVKSQA